MGAPELSYCFYPTTSRFSLYLDLDIYSYRLFLFAIICYIIIVSDVFLDFLYSAAALVVYHTIRIIIIKLLYFHSSSRIL
jgi:hypothetical protein